VIGGVVLALLLAAVDDPCAAVPPAASTPDRAAAAEYRSVGDAERAAGSRDTATVAYRAALARDPGDEHARAALAALCGEAARAGAFERGLARMKAGDREAAVAAFEEARAGGRDAAATLLEGVCLVELGEHERATPLLLEARAVPAHREAASFFLGLAALRAGRSGEAVGFLESAAADRRLGPTAMDLARMARRDGRVVLSILLDGGWDSNVDLTPDRAAKVASSGDTSGGVTALARVAPFGDEGPFLRGTGVLTNQARYDALDLRGGGVAGGWQLGHAGRYLLGEWGWEGRQLGGAPYLSAQRLLGAARTEVGAGASLGLAYFARWESFLATDAEAYSGLRQLAEADVTVALGARSSATFAWHGGWDAARDPSLAWREQGPRAGVRLSLGRDAWIGLDAALTFRGYDEVDPALGVARADRYVDLGALLERDLSERWTLRASLSARRALSNVADFEYTRLVPSIGLAWTIGLL
jgi:tetratricopeptide (TPR) repeat protein